MGCTIDHLRSGIRVRVLRTFTDAAGSVHHAGERAVIEHLGVDWGRAEIQMDWHGEARTERLRFPLNAQSGPRNGSMREFLAVEGDAPGTPAAPTRRSEPEPDSHRGPTAAVPCDCDPHLHLPVLCDPGEIGVHACLRCGRTAVARHVGDDGRFHGEAWDAWVPIPVSDPLTRWLSQWPRVRVVRPETRRWPMAASLVRTARIDLPADLRCGDAAALEAQLRTASPPATGRTAAERFRRVAPPPVDPPERLPAGLTRFLDACDALRASRTTPTGDLLRLARAGSPASDIAVRLLWEGPDPWTLGRDLLDSNDAALRASAHALLLEAPPGDARVPRHIIRLLDRLPLDPSPDNPERLAAAPRAEALLVLLLDRAERDPDVLDCLSRLARRVARHDPWLARCTHCARSELARPPGSPAPAPPTAP